MNEEGGSEEGGKRQDSEFRVKWHNQDFLTAWTWTWRGKERNRRRLLGFSLEPFAKRKA